MNVLIVDADWQFVAQVTPFLEDKAHHVAHQVCPTQAARQVQQWKPDLVILAADLADDALVRTIYGLPDRPAVLLTESMDRYAHAWRVWQHCGDELVLKPLFKRAEFHDAIVQARLNAVTADTRERRKAG